MTNPVKYTYSQISNPLNLVLIKEDNSFVEVGDFEATDEQLWDMADGFLVVGFNRYIEPISKRDYFYRESPAIGGLTAIVAL